MLDYLTRVPDLVKTQDLRDAMGFERTGWDDNHYSYATTLNTLRRQYPTINFDTFNSMSVFGVIRNPWDRMVSMFLHRQRKPKYNTAKDQQVLNRGFEYWLLNTEHRADKEITKRAQLEWFDHCDNCTLIKQDDLNTQWLKAVSNTSDIDGSLPVKHTSNKPISTYDQYHSEATVDYIGNVFKRDIEWGGWVSPKVLYDV